MRWRSLLLGFLIFLLGLGTGRVGPRLGGLAAAVPLPLPPRVQASPVEPLPPPAGEASEALLERLYEVTSPSVVSLRVVSRTGDLSPLLEPQDRLPKAGYRQGLGSGFVYDREGHIVTNYHVVRGAEKIFVTFSQGDSRQARVVGADPDADLAVVAVDSLPEGVRPLTLAAYEPRVGQQVIAIGNPFGLSGSMTTGVISALGRSIPAPARSAPRQAYSIPGVLQTDAAVNPGNSGGPLLDIQGEVVGLNAAIESRSGGSDGVGFAIPATMMRLVVPALVGEGRYEHAWLGVSVTSMPPELVEQAKLPVGSGAMVVEVVPDSPADRAGLKGATSQVILFGQRLPGGGDILVEVSGQAIRRADDLVEYLFARSRVGVPLTIKLYRDGRPMTVEVVPAARPHVG